MYQFSGRVFVCPELCFKHLFYARPFFHFDVLVLHVTRALQVMQFIRFVSALASAARRVASPLLSRGNLYVVSSHADYKQARSTVCGRVCVIVLIVEAQLCAPWGTSPNNRVRCKVLRYYPHLMFSVQMRCMLHKTCDGQIAKVPKVC